MKKQKLPDLYPTATRGRLKLDPDAIPPIPKKPLFRVRDRSPGTIIAMGAIAAAALGLFMLATVYYLYLS